MSRATGPYLPAVGLDVGAGRLHGVRLEAGPGGALRVAGRLRPAAPLARGPNAGAAGAAAVREAVAFCRGAARIAVDGPAGPSAGAHLADDTVAPKFRAGRCSEVPAPGVAPVSWVTPIDAGAAAGWMRTSFALWAALRDAALEVVETYPAAAFHRLNGGRWPPSKSTPAGRAARLQLLEPHLSGCGGRQEAADGTPWGHDDIDAAVAALVAATGSPVPHSCPHPDGSALWLPPHPAGQGPAPTRAGRPGPPV